jgi:hypothetical protein
MKLAPVFANDVGTRINKSRIRTRDTPNHLAELGQLKHMAMSGMEIEVVSMRELFDASEGVDFETLFFLICT